ncbi:MAG: hypothetical protein HY782_22725 [Chloroflexi bacterium]|nr:hypothetical protein [Chloroflexota bacterium]
MAKKNPKATNEIAGSLEEKYPHLAEWVMTHGWIEVGQLEGISAFAMALDESGDVWRGKKNYKTLDEAFQALEEGIAKWMREEWGRSE